jgi:hypothetical protein
LSNAQLRCGAAEIPGARNCDKIAKLGQIHCAMTVHRP